MDSLFTTESGKPLSFVLLGFSAPSARSFIKKIQEAGGEVKKTISQDSIIIIANEQKIPKEIPSGSPYYSISFIEKCLEQEQLLDISEFLLGENKAPSKTPTKSPIKSPRKRDKFTLEDDEKILDYVAENQNGKSPTGKKLWQEMASTMSSHTAESLRTRYLRVLRPQRAERQEVEEMQEQEKEQEKEHEKENNENEETINKPAEGSKKRKSEQRSTEVDSIRKRRINQLIDQMTEQHNVPKSVVYHALLIYSGDVILANEYLQKKGKNCSVQGWTLEEDTCIVEKGIVPKTGRKLDEIRRRIQFLDEANSINNE